MAERTEEELAERKDSERDQAEAAEAASLRRQAADIAKITSKTLSLRYGQIIDKLKKPPKKL